MARLSKDDVREIIDLIEDELYSIPRFDRMQKMRMRTKIRKQETWLVMLKNPSSDTILSKLQSKLPELAALYPYGLTEELRDVVKSKVFKMRKQAVKERFIETQRQQTIAQRARGG